MVNIYQKELGWNMFAYVVSVHQCIFSVSKEYRSLLIDLKSAAVPACR